ncbi:hypothetical protein [Xenorhabdus innexi]|uniref:Uncharacterized protein n=1 Tax=Xenorhabdus innexi TaxID=290109 RepID=A0A1N6MXS1_9GAMM|nr:hypothetical protein [Xenorhabdus innexi]PHM31181.1 hypothetical protein Xinn_02959 [Xenorhabdus innexi]SIP73683.1 hypothetical protein XIS1_450037 [Xenorhabdus innexi]
MSVLEKIPFYIEVTAADVKIEQKTRTNKNTGEITPYYLQRVIAHMGPRSMTETVITLSEPNPLPEGKYLISGSSLYPGKPFGDNPPRLEFNQWNVSYVPMETVKLLIKI